MPDLSVRGHRLGYDARPEDLDRSSLTVVFIHGSGGDSEDWKGQLEGLSDQANMVALELPGHGTSEPPGETTIEAYSVWAIDFVEALGLERVVLVGCSLGSAITQWIALSPRPWLVGIGLVGAGARLKVHPAFLDGLKDDSSKALRMLSDFTLSEDPDKALHAELTEKFIKTSPELILGDLSACNEFDVMEKVAEISLPTLILVGQDDKMTPVKYSRFLAEKIPGSRLAIVPGAGHLVMVEKPEEFNAQLRDFLSDLS